MAAHPDVELVHDDGRSWMARTDRQFSVVQMSLIDTWAATGAGAHALGENGLYTVEAWRTFLSRLAPGGLFTVSRWFQKGSRDETARLVALGVAALQESGVKVPRGHVILAQAGLVSTLILSRDPFVLDEVMRARGAAGTKGFRLLLAPACPTSIPCSGRSSTPRGGPRSTASPSGRCSISGRPSTTGPSSSTCCGCGPGSARSRTTRAA